MNKITQEQKKPKMFRTLCIIALMAITGYFVLIWISPESRNLSRFLIGFAAAFSLIVLVAYYLKYVFNLYFEIKKGKQEL